MILKELHIDFASPVPVYEQLKRKLKHAIAKNTLKANDPLPSIRELASFLKINPNTVARAYRELSQESIIGGRAGKGFWVEAGGRIEAEKADLLREDFLKFMEKAVDMGFSADDLRDLVDGYLKEEK